MPVLDRALANLGARVEAEAQRVDQLIQEHGHTVIDLRFGGRWNRPRGDPRSAPPDELFAVYGNEFMEHDTSLCGAYRNCWAEQRGVQNNTSRDFCQPARQYNLLSFAVPSKSD